MPLVLNEEQQALKESATIFFAEKSPVDTIRKLRDSNDATGFDRAVWKQIGDMGWPATMTDFSSPPGSLSLASICGMVLPSFRQAIASSFLSASASTSIS